LVGNHYKTPKEYKSFLEYKEVEKSVKNAVRNAKKNFEKQLAKKSRRHNKSFYSYVQNKTKSKSNVGPLLKQDGDITSDDKEMTELLNIYFSSVFSAEGDGPIPTLSRLPSEETLITTFFDESDIIEKIDLIICSLSTEIRKLDMGLLSSIGCNESNASDCFGSILVKKSAINKYPEYHHQCPVLPGEHTGGEPSAYDKPCGLHRTYHSKKVSKDKV